MRRITRESIHLSTLFLLEYRKVTSERASYCERKIDFGLPRHWIHHDSTMRE